LGGSDEGRTCPEASKAIARAGGILISTPLEVDAAPEGGFHSRGENREDSAKGVSG